jgi:protein-tyrosine-phosphatase
MAEGIFRYLADDRFDVFPANIKPSFVSPNAIAAMREIRINISHHYSTHVNECASHVFDCGLGQRTRDLPQLVIFRESFTLRVRRVGRF